MQFKILILNVWFISPFIHLIIKFPQGFIMLTQWNTCHRNRTAYWVKIVKFWCRLSGFEAWPCHLLAVWPWVGYRTSLLLHLSNVILIASSFLIRWLNYYAKLLSIMLKFDYLCKYGSISEFSFHFIDLFIYF